MLLVGDQAHLIHGFSLKVTYECIQEIPGNFVFEDASRGGIATSMY